MHQTRLCVSVNSPVTGRNSYISFVMRLTLPAALAASCSLASRQCAVSLASRHCTVVLLNSVNATNSTFQWEAVDAFQGDRVAALRRKANEPPPPILDRLATGMRRAGARQAILILLFVFLTFADVIFNVSRGFICALPGDLCAPIAPDSSTSE